MNLQQIDVTGCRIIGAITKELGHDGPKHHAVVLGRSLFDREVYVAELMTAGYQVTTYRDFDRRYSANGQVIVQANDGPLSNLQVAQRAIAELKQSGTKYDLVVNNCECFVNRAMHGHSASTQVVNTAIGIITLVGLVWVLKNSR
jgi:Lecithin retinol acyltransferase